MSMRPEQIDLTEEQEKRLHEAFTFQVATELARMKVQMIRRTTNGKSPIEGMSIVGSEWRKLRENCADYATGRIGEYRAAYHAARAAAERLRREGFTVPARYTPVRPWQHTAERRRRVAIKEG